MNTDQATIYCASKSNECLEFIIKDCEDAVRAMPQSPKAIEYLILRSEAERQLLSRKRLAQWRKTIRDNGFDDLLYPYLRWRKDVRRENKTAYTKDRLRSAYWIIGWYRISGLI